MKVSRNNKLEALSAIALNTFRETVRDRILYAFVFFAGIVTIMAILLGNLSVGQDVRIISDIGLAVIALIGGIIAVFVGANLVYKELDRKTIFLIFTKPVTGWQFVLGKYIGLALCMFVVIGSMGLFLSGLLLLARPEHVASLIWGISASLSLVYLELLFVTALAIFFSTFATPFMSVLFTLSLWLIGHFGRSLQELGRLTPNKTIAEFFQLIYFILPDLACLTKIRSVLMYGSLPDVEVVSYLVSYVFAYVVLLLVLSAIVTEQREFT